MGLAGCVLGVVRLARGLDHHVGLGETCVEVAGDHLDVAGGVVRGVVDTSGVGLVVDHGCSVGEGCFDGEHRREFVVVDVDQGECLERGDP